MKFRVDASANGCSGMFWRTAMDMNKTSSESNWPRNGTVLDGEYADAAKEWVKFVVNGSTYYLPVKQHNKPVVHEN